jgi:hypothetical protein
VFGVRRHRRGFAPRFENRRGQPGRQAAVRRPAVQLQPTDPAGGKQLGDADRVARTETEPADRSGRFGRAHAAVQGRPLYLLHLYIIYFYYIFTSLYVPPLRPRDKSGRSIPLLESLQI